MPRPKWTHVANVETGTGLRACRARIVERYPDGDYVKIEFEHPTVRRMIASRIIALDSLRELLPDTDA